MKPIWISSTKAAELLGISDRQVRRSVSMWNYRWSEKDGRKVLEIDVRSLPAEASNRYVQETLPEAPEVATRAEDVETVIRSYDRATDRAKKNFDKWTLILLKCEGITGTKELGRFVDEWNKAHPEMKTSIKSIYRQRASVEDGGKISLINHRETMRSTVTDTMFDDFKTAYLTANKLSAFSSWMIAFGKAKERGECKGEDDFPSKSAFVRRLKSEFAPDVIYFAREGKKKFYDNKGYHLDRDYSDLKAGQVWVGDTRTWDVFVKVQGQEKPTTPRAPRTPCVPCATASSATVSRKKSTWTTVANTATATSPAKAVATRSWKTSSMPNPWQAASASRCTSPSCVTPVQRSLNATS